jgi:hypothetical protein
MSEYPFRIILPATVAGFSTATFVDYRCTWRVEAGALFVSPCPAPSLYMPPQFSTMSPLLASARDKSDISSCR